MDASLGLSTVPSVTHHTPGATAPTVGQASLVNLTNRHLARLAGTLYLVVAVCGGFSELVVRAGVRVPGDPTATADNIRASASTFLLGFVTDLIDITFFVFLGWVLYVLLSPVNQRIAATFIICIAIASAMMGINLLNHMGALLVATDPTYANAFGARAADGLAFLFLNLHQHGYLIAQIFFCLWLVPLGYLVFKSGLFPRALGMLLMLGGAAYLGDLVVMYSSPGFESSLAMYFGLVAGLAELSFLLWLLVMGAREVQR